MECRLYNNRSYCPECHPYIAGCVVVVILLFSMYHADDIDNFVTSIFRKTNANTSDSPSSPAAIRQHPNFIDTTKAVSYNGSSQFITNSALQLHHPVLLLFISILPNIFLIYV